MTIALTVTDWLTQAVNVPIWALLSLMSLLLLPTGEVADALSAAVERRAGRGR